MKILILCSNYEPGGAQRAAIRLNRSLRSGGFTSELYFFHPKSELVVEDAPLFIREQAIRTIPDFISFIKALNHQIKTTKPDVVLSLLPFANIIGQLVAWYHRVPQRVSSHRNVSQKELSGLMKKLDQFFAQSGVYTQITAVSESTKQSFSYYNPKAYRKISVVNNGLDFVPSNKTKAECRLKFGLPTSTFIVGNIGRMVEQKNQQILIRAFAGLQDALLVIVGKGEQKEALRRLAEELNLGERLVFIEEIKSVDMPDFYNAIDVFAMPSLFEGLSNALIEALSASLPIISSDVDSQKDVLYRQSDGLMAGLTLPVDDTEAWSRAIQSLQHDEALRTQLAQKALIRSSDFSIHQMTQGFIEVFQKSN